MNTLIVIASIMSATLVPTQDDLRVLLAKTPVASPLALIPELAVKTPDTLAVSGAGRSLLSWAETAAGENEIPATTYTLYREFRKTGERNGYQAPYARKRTLLTQEVIRWWLANKADRLDRINDLLWNICEETTWVVPAHEKTPDFIDLFAAETGADLAHIVTLMGDALPNEIQERVRAELARRIINPYLEVGRKYGWGRGLNNWTGVCAGSIGETVLLVEPDLDRQAKALALVLEQLDRFIENAFESDGGCLEGIGYWNYGLLHYVSFAEMMRARTGGKIDLLAQPPIKLIAKYPLAVSLGGTTYASFSDAHETASVIPYLGVTLAERTGETGLLAMIKEPHRWTLGTVLRDILVWDGARPAPPPLRDVVMPVSGIARLVCKSGGKQVVLAAKAGSNAEPHNHNDVGSFVVAVDEEVLLCDPGPGLYTRDYFSSARYQNTFANSYGHSVPQIGGKMQSPGAEFRGQMKKTGKKSIEITFHKAYDEPRLTHAARHFTVAPKRIRMEDEFVFKNDNLDVEEAFLTWKEVQVDGGKALIKGRRATLELAADQGRFHAEKLEEACRQNRKSEVLTRLSVTYPPAQNLKPAFSICVR